MWSAQRRHAGDGGETGGAWNEEEVLGRHFTAGELLAVSMRRPKRRRPMADWRHERGPEKAGRVHPFDLLLFYIHEAH